MNDEKPEPYKSFDTIVWILIVLFGTLTLVVWSWQQIPPEPNMPVHYEEHP